MAETAPPRPRLWSIGHRSVARLPDVCEDSTIARDRPVYRVNVVGIATGPRPIPLKHGPSPKMCGAVRTTPSSESVREEQNEVDPPAFLIPALCDDRVALAPCWR